MPVTRVSLGTMEMGRRMDLEQSREFLRLYLDSGHTELDTAFMYAGGSSGGPDGGRTEEFLGKLLGEESALDGGGGVEVATKVNPGDGKTLSGESIRHQLSCSLRKLGTDQVDLFYLHWPCREVELGESLAEVDKLHREGAFSRWGLSNFAAWQVAAVVEICRARGYTPPSVYQGMYNCLTRAVEVELLGCLRRYGMSFYCYNPLAGGLLTGKHSRTDNPEEREEQGRFNGLSWGAKYRERFWRECYFDAMEVIQEACAKEGVTILSAALRWVLHHSQLDDKYGDGLVIGASTPEHLKHNLEVIKEGPLPDSVVEAIEKAHMITKGHGPPYFRNVNDNFSAK